MLHMANKNRELGIATNNPKFRGFVYESRRKDSLKNFPKLEESSADKLSDAGFYFSGG